MCREVFLKRIIEAQLSGICGKVALKRNVAGTIARNSDYSNGGHV
jgi:hypothetical protein